MVTPGSEIEITPEMIEAGVEAYYSWGQTGTVEAIVASVFEAMLAARHGPIRVEIEPGMDWIHLEPLETILEDVQQPLHFRHSSS